MVGGAQMANVIAQVKAAKWMKEFDALIKHIGECKSKAEEDRIITAELEVLKQRLNDPKLDKTRGREYMVRLMYCEMLGHDTSWAYIKCLQFASENNLQTKKAAYLALTQLLDHNSELILLLCNTLLSDLKNDNYLIVSSALGVTSRLIGPDLINAVYGSVVEKLKHPKENVRKKAVMALHRFQQLDPRGEQVTGLDKHFRTMLCDKDPSVMSASLCALHEVIKLDAKQYKNLIASFCSILKQVSEHRLPKTYDYHRVPAPFIQIKLLKVLAALGVNDRSASENMYAVVSQTLQKASSSHTIGHAIIYECVRTITTIYPNPTLLAQAAEKISVLLRSSSHNLKYVGVDALAGIVKISPKYAQEHQLAVIDCLEDPDDSLKLKTLELLYKMTKSNNVEVIVERMMTYLRSSTDEHVKRDIACKASQLAERYAPDPHWFIGVISEIFELGGEHVEEQLAHNVMRLIAEQDDELHRSAVDMYLGLLDKPVLPEILLQVICWVLGEYGSLAPVPPAAVTAKLLGVLASQKPSDSVCCYLLTAVSKLCAQTGTGLGPEVQGLVVKAGNSQNVELQQRAYELQALLSLNSQQLAEVLPADSSCEEFGAEELASMKQLSFLQWHVDQALQGGARPYLEENQRSRSSSPTHSAKGQGLRFQAYEKATAPTPAPLTQAPAPSHASHAQALHDPFDLGGGGATMAGGRSASPFNQPAPAAAAGHQPMPMHQPAAPSGPTLALRPGSNRRWGPAQFERPAAPPAATTAPAPAAAAPASGPDYGAAPAPAAAAASRPAGAAAPSRPQSEKDKLAASIFGSSAPTTSKYRRPTGAASSPNRATRAAAPTPPPPPPEVDLLDLSDPDPTPSDSLLSEPAPAAATGVDLLLDGLGAPEPLHPHAAPMANLLGDEPPAPGPGNLLPGYPPQPVPYPQGNLMGAVGAVTGMVPGMMAGAVPVGGMAPGAAGMPGVIPMQPAVVPAAPAPVQPAVRPRPMLGAHKNTTTDPFKDLFG